MIKIVKHGKRMPKIKTVYECICPFCSCVFDFESEDIISQERAIDGVAKIKCPDCSNTFSFVPSQAIKLNVELSEDATGS